jgi:predicted PurR-regulated permease PerM
MMAHTRIRPVRLRPYGQLEEPSFTRSVVRVVLIVVIAAISLYLLYLVRQPLAWMFLAAFIAVAMSGPVTFLSRYMKRGFAIALSYLALILAPFALLAIFVPPIVEGINTLADNAPRYAQDVTEFVQDNERLRELNEDYDITQKLQEEAAKLPDKIGDVAGALGDIGVGIVNSVFAAVTILTLSLFMIGGGPRWQRAFLARQPPERAAALQRTFDNGRDAIANYVRGALLQAAIAGISAWIVLEILGVPGAPALAVVVFVLDLVPLIGATLGAIVAGIVTVFADFPIDTIIWTIFSIVYQQFENNVIQPRIQARAVQIEPIMVLVSVLFGSTLFGIAGALLAIPITATIQVAAREYLDYRNLRMLEVEGGGDDEPPSAPPAAAPAPP